jgi:hypothetical protein
MVSGFVQLVVPFHVIDVALNDANDRASGDPSSDAVGGALECDPQ